MRFGRNNLYRILEGGEPYMQKLLTLLNGLIYVAAIVLIAGVVYEHGFPVTPEQRVVLRGVYRAVWILFLTDTTAEVLFRYENAKRNFRTSAWLLSGALYLTLIPVLFDKPDISHQWLQYVWSFFASQPYHVIILLILSVLQLSNAFVRILGRRTNPSLILAVSFLVIILIGAGLLMLPRSTQHGISFIDALFVATSAVCVTGLTPVEISEVLTPSGLVILILLIQIGGLGVMTLTSFFALFFMGNTSVYNQLIVKDMISSDSIGSLLSTMWHILGFTLVIEACGMGAIFLSIHNITDMALGEELAFSAFHSISAFCNAGFSTMAGNLGSPLITTGHNALLLSVSMLIILGGIGFPILVNFRLSFLYYVRRIKGWVSRKNAPHTRPHLYNLNTKIVLITTLALLVIGTALIAYFEWNHSFAGMPVSYKWTEAFFNAVSPRTAGFTTLPLASMAIQTLLLYALLMWIGGAAQSTAGGIKVNAFAVVVLNMAAVFRGSNKVEIFGRELSPDSVKRSNATVIMSGITLFTAVFLLTITEKGATVFELAFEAVSAISTVGSSLDLTPKLSVEGKSIIILLMFMGRVGLITLMMGIIRQKKYKRYRYPMDQIIIN